MMMMARFLCALALAFVLPLMAPAADSDGTVNVLTIGNSFSIDLTEYLPTVAKNRGVRLDLMNLYIPGCSLERHWNSAST